MQYIKLQLADNGVIKTVVDDNINGAGEVFESTNVYEFNLIENRIKFIEEICTDIGLEFGNSKSRTQIKIKSDWGDHYQPNKTEVDEKIKQLQAEISRLQNLKNG